jgi:hypothetical protein
MEQGLQEGRKESGEGRNSPLKAAQQLHAKPERHNQLNKLKNRCWQQKQGSSGMPGTYSDIAPP